MATGSASGSKSAYKERLSFPDPLSKESTSQTTWYRLKKRKLAKAETEWCIVNSGELSQRQWSASPLHVGSELSDSDSVLDDPESLNQFKFWQEPMPTDDFILTVHEPDDDDMHTESSVSDDELDSDVTSNPLSLEAGELLFDSFSLTVPASC